VKLNTDLVGVQLPTIAVEVTDRRCMNFAASVGDGNPWYFDDERPEGTVAPPLLAVSLTWPLAIAYADKLRERGYDAVIRRQVHYTEHVEWRRPMRTGEVLQVTGTVAAILPHAAGTYGLVRFEAFDAEGQTVFVENSGALFRGIRREGGNEGGDTGGIPPVPERVENSEPVWTHTLHIDPLAAHVYDGCADLHFPIHTSKQFAHKVGLPGTIIHGTCTLALAVRELTNLEAGGDPRRLKAVSCRFTGMVLPDTDITVRLVGTSDDGARRNLFFDVLNADGRKAIGEGHLAIE